MSRIRVLIVDDAVVVRKLYPHLPVIMFSTLTARGASATLDALSLGASDYVTKPANVGGVTQALARVRDDLIPKIKALCGCPSDPSASLMGQLTASPLALLKAPARPPVWATPKTTTPTVKPQPGDRPTTPTPPSGRVELLVVAASTGGPNALTAFFTDLGRDFPVPVLVVQHMPPVFTRLLAERLTAKTGVRIAEAVDGGRLESGAGWIAPGDFHMTLDRAAGPCVRLNQGPQENGCRPAADVLFRSAAAAGAGVLAVVLTGMGQDGFRGCEAITAKGGRVLAQDEATSVVWGMPGFVARGGLADHVLPLSQLGAEVVRRVRVGRAAASPAGRTS